MVHYKEWNADEVWLPAGAGLAIMSSFPEGILVFILFFTFIFSIRISSSFSLALKYEAIQRDLTKLKNVGLLKPEHHERWGRD